MRLALAILTVVAGALGLERLAIANSAEGKPPPVRLLLITLDTLRADRLGVYGHEAPTSPAIDRLASGATVFKDVTCSMPTTLPSHLTILTGLTPVQHGVTANGRVAARDLTSIFELLEPRGVRTAAVVSARVLEQKYLVGLGIDDFFMGDGRPMRSQVAGDAVTDQAIDWLSEHGERPFALWLHYFDSHEPYTPPSDFAQRFAGDYQGPLGDALTLKWLVALNSESAPDLSRRDRQHVADLYDAEIAFLDAQLDRLFRYLKEQQLWQDTLIVLTGDHGQALGEDGFWGHGEQLLEPVIQVPLIVKLPRQKQALTIEQPFETLDILPTIVDYFDLESPPEGGGRSLMPVLSGGALEERPARVIERRSYASAPQRIGLALHGGDWKLIFYRETDGDSYHLGRSGGEGGLDGENFYAPGTPEDRLLRRVAAGRTRSPTAPEELAPETLEMLRSLGYVE